MSDAKMRGEVNIGLSFLVTFLSTPYILVSSGMGKSGSHVSGQDNKVSNVYPTTEV